METLNIGFVGFGLIGGSIARALKAVHPQVIITVTSRSSKPLFTAQKDGIVDIIAPEVNASFSDCDFIFLCTPVLTITTYLSQLKEIKKDTCIITDVGSVKGVMHDAVIALDMEDCFIGGHPMAGSERTGYENSSASLMVDARYVITPTAKTKQAQLDSYVRLVQDMKSVPIVMNATQHDQIVAAISHLPHLAAASLVNTVKKNEDSNALMHQLAAGGFKDTTRVAASSPEMWEQICLTNADAISEILTTYIEILTDVKNHISQHDTGYVENLFDEARTYRNTF